MPKRIWSNWLIAKFQSMCIFLEIVWPYFILILRPRELKIDGCFYEFEERFSKFGQSALNACTRDRLTACTNWSKNDLNNEKKI